MTREEAIAILQEEIDGNLELTLSEWRERDEQKLFPAIRMAIEALQTDKAIIENIRVTMSDGDIFYFSADAVSREVYDKRTQADEEIIDSYRQEFQKALSAEAVQGEWEHWGSPFSDESEVIYTIVCSVCGARFIEPKGELKGEYNFCPNCGAKMKGGAE